MTATVEGIISLAAGEALEADRLVKMSGATVVYADEGDPAVGVTCYAAASGAQVAIRTITSEGLVKLTAAGAITAGAALYTRDDGKVDDAANDENNIRPIGYAVTAATASGGKVAAILLGGNYDPYGPLALSITDPGDTGAIPVVQSGTVQLVSAGAETRTLAAPTFAGQMLQICFKTDGGDVTITCATTVNQTGNNTAVTADAGDSLLLIAAVSGANLRWRVVANDGFALSTV